jgi:hypothetical protein
MSMPENIREEIVIVPRNKKSIPKGTLSSIWRQAGITNEIADSIWNQKPFEII